MDVGTTVAGKFGRRRGDVGRHEFQECEPYRQLRPRGAHRSRNLLERLRPMRVARAMCKQQQSSAWHRGHR
jgi:hypothetical protein